MQGKKLGIILRDFFFFILQKVHWLELRTEIVCTVIDLHKMLETDLKSGKTYCIQRLEKMSQIGNTTFIGSVIFVFG